MAILRKSKFMTLLMTVVLSSTLLVGCGGKESTGSESGQTANETQEESGLSGRVTVAGSTTVVPYAEKLAQAFESDNPNVQIDIQGLGSSAGVRAAAENTANIGMSSRDLKDDEKAEGITEHVMAHEAIAVVTHPSNKIENLDMETVAKIFKGEITNWKEVGGEDTDIIVVSREAGSGTRGAFDEIVGLIGDDKASLLSERALIGDGNGAVKQNLVRNENSIGYLSLAFVDKDLKALKVGDVEPTNKTVIAGEYKISRPLLMLTKGDIDDATKGYLDFIFTTEGQKIVEETGAVPVK